jgi:hypothetical protein
VPAVDAIDSDQMALTAWYCERESQYGQISRISFPLVKWLDCHPRLPLEQRE